MAEKQNRDALRTVLEKCESGFRPLINPDELSPRLDLAVRCYFRDMKNGGWPTIPDQENMFMEDIIREAEPALKTAPRGKMVQVMDIAEDGQPPRMYLNALLYLINQGYPAFLVRNGDGPDSPVTALVAHGK